MTTKSKLAALAEHAASVAKEFYGFEHPMQRKPRTLDTDEIFRRSDEKKSRWPVEPRFFILDEKTGRNMWAYSVGEYEVHADGSITVKYDIQLKQDIVAANETEKIPNLFPENMRESHTGSIEAGILVQGTSLEKILAFTPGLGFPLSCVAYYLFEKDSLNLASAKPQFKVYTGQ